MHLNNGSIGAGISTDSNRRLSLKTLLFELAITIGVFGICVILIICWNKPPKNNIEVETAYLGPQSTQIMGIKVVRDYGKESSANFKLYDSVVNVPPQYFSHKDEIDITNPNSIVERFGSTLLPGVHVGVMTRMSFPCRSSLFADTIVPEGYVQEGSLNFKEISQELPIHLQGSDLRNNDIGLVSSLLIRSTRRKDLRPFKEMGILVPIEQVNLNITNLERTKEYYSIKNNRIVPIVDTIRYIGATFTNRIEDSPLLRLFGYSPIIYDNYKISQETLADLYFSSEQKKRLDLLEQIYPFATGIQELTRRTSQLTDKINHLNDSEIKDTANAVNAIASIFKDGIELNSDYNKMTEQINAKYKSINTGRELNDLRAYVDTIIDKKLSFVCKRYWGKQPCSKEPGKALSCVTLSKCGLHHQFVGYSYFTSSFIKPNNILTMQDLSRTIENIRIKPVKDFELMKFEYDFRTPVDGLVCSVGSEVFEPDVMTSTGFVITNQKILDAIVSKGLNVSAHFPEWDTTQTKRFFRWVLLIHFLVIRTDRTH